MVAKGDGYLITTDQPDHWERATAVPTIDVICEENAGLIVRASFTDLVAYGASGIVWKMKQLSWDNLKIVSVTDGEITGEFWDLRTEAKQRFVVDLETGASRGGAVIPETKLRRPFIGSPERRAGSREGARATRRSGRV